jgi:hypothetical protein
MVKTTTAQAQNARDPGWGLDRGSEEADSLEQVLSPIGVVIAKI